MPDRLSISLWLQEWDEDTVLENWHKLLGFFPYAPTRPGVQSVLVQPLDWTEPPTFEQNFGEGASADECLEAVQQFQHSDCAYQANAFWEVENVPCPVKIIAYGPDFEGRDDEQGHIELDLGAEVNVTQLVFLMHELPKRLKLRKRLLWSESGEDVSNLLGKSANKSA